jgi:hypothetical protein
VRRYNYPAVPQPWSSVGEKFSAIFSYFFERRQGEHHREQGLADKQEPAGSTSLKAHPTKVAFQGGAGAETQVRRERRQCGQQVAEGGALVAIHKGELTTMAVRIKF